jgi:GAF domain-containing protein
MGSAINSQPEAVIDHFAAILERDGLVAALGFLNARTRYRFTGVYRFDAPILRNVALFDRENPHLRLGGDLPMLGSPCSLVEAATAPFVSPDTRHDPRFGDHRPPALVVAYCGVPLFSESRTCFGSLCHYDPRPRVVPMSEIPLLEQAAVFVMRAVAQAQHAA